MILIVVIKGSDITVKKINDYMKENISGSYGYKEEPLVSSDIIDISVGSLFDTTQTMVNKIIEDLYQVQVFTWYDNKYSYTAQMIRILKYLAIL